MARASEKTERTATHCAVFQRKPLGITVKIYSGNACDNVQNSLSVAKLANLLPQLVENRLKLDHGGCGQNLGLLRR